jgi:hypothetical protein
MAPCGSHRPIIPEDMKPSRIAPLATGLSYRKGPMPVN